MTPSKIQVYCTVGSDELQASPDGSLLCTRCARSLVNLDDPAAVERAMASGSGPHCGFVRRMAVPALASSLLLSACSTPSNQVLMGETAAPEKQNTGDNKTQLMMGTPLAHPPAKPSRGTNGSPAPWVGKMIGPPARNPEGKEWPIARAVPDRPGFVYSPYTNRIVDVEKYPAHSLVCDPGFPMSAQKYFRVPAAGQ